MITEKEEQIIRVAKAIGNGAHVFVPKEWTGEEIVLVRPRKKSLKERILGVLDPYLDSILGVYLFGSYARTEESIDSDIDLFVITDKKMKISSEGFEIVCLEEKDIEKALRIEPILIYSILSESKPIINSRLLGQIRSNYIPKKEDFKGFFTETEGMIKVSEETLESQKGEYLISEATVYSLVLRLRGLFIIKSLLDGERYSNKSFKRWIKSNLPKIDFESIYEAYRYSKDEKKLTQKIKVLEMKLLVEFLRNELNKLR